MLDPDYLWKVLRRALAANKDKLCLTGLPKYDITTFVGETIVTWNSLTGEVTSHDCNLPV